MCMNKPKPGTTLGVKLSGKRLWTEGTDVSPNPAYRILRFSASFSNDVENRETWAIYDGHGKAKDKNLILQ